MHNEILKLIERLEGDMENADRQAVDKTVSTQQQHYYAGKAAAFSDCTHLLTLLLGSQPNSEPQPLLQQTHVMWAQSAEPLPCCSKCGMPGQQLGTRCLAEDCPGSRQGNGA